MAQAMTFTSLVEDIKAYLDRGELTDTQVNTRIPQFINDAERKLAFRLGVQGYQDTLRFAMVAGVSAYKKPDRYRSTISMQIGTTAPFALPTAAKNVRQHLYTRSNEFLRAYWPDDTERKQPQYYADYGLTHWLIAPTPDDAYPVEVIVKAMPSLLDAQNQTNYLTEYAPHILRLGTLINATPFVREDKRMGTWKGEYEEAIAALTETEIKKIVDRSATRQEA